MSITGVVLATFAFSWESSKKLIVDSDIIEDEKTGAKKKVRCRLL